METENDDKKVVATLIKSSAKFEYYSCSYNGLRFECRKNKITGETKFLMNSELLLSTDFTLLRIYKILWCGLKVHTNTFYRILWTPETS